MQNSRLQGYPHQEEAVSPVIGVMLMITVTIIIAATLSAFVGGSTGDLKKSPQATIVIRSGSDGDIVFEHRGGDMLRTEDLEIVTWVKDPDGKMVRHVQRPDEERVTLSGASESVRLPVMYESRSGMDTTREFGSSVWKTGTIAGTWDREATAKFLGLVDTDELDSLVANNTPVEIDIVHRPSGIVILKSTMLIGE